MFRQFKWNFLCIVMGVSLIGFIIGDLILYSTIKKYLFEQTFEQMRSKTELAAKLLEEQNLAALIKNSSALNNLTYQIRTVVKARVTFIDTTGKVLSDSDIAPDIIPTLDNHFTRLEVIEAQNKGWGKSYRQSKTMRRNIFYTAFLMTYQQKPVGFLRLAYYAHHFEESLSRIFTFILAANFIGLSFLFGVAYYLGKAVITPINQLTLTAQNVIAGNLHQRFNVNRKDELGKLAILLNQLTEQVKSQINQMSDERNKIEHILNNIDIGIIVVDANKRILHANPEISRILKIELNEIEKKVLIETLRIEPLLTAVDQTIASQTKEIGEFTIHRENEKMFIAFMVLPFAMIRERQPGALIQIQDISELKRLEAIRREFVVNASHELKTPLTAIIGYTEMLLKGVAKIPATQMKFIRRISEQAQRIEFLVTDLLHLSQVENEIPLELKKLNLLSIIKDVIEEFKERSDQKGIHVVLDSADKKVTVKADKELLQTALSNLLDNAIKYTLENGSIRVRVTATESNRIKIEINDTGIGIDPKYHERIFQRFYRVDKARSSTFGGTGLGLAIVKHIIEKHHSKIYVESEHGKGSSFWFELDRAND